MRVGGPDELRAAFLCWPMHAQVHRAKCLQPCLHSHVPAWLMLPSLGHRCPSAACPAGGHFPHSIDQPPRWCRPMGAHLGWVQGFTPRAARACRRATSLASTWPQCWTAQPTAGIRRRPRRPGVLMGIDAGGWEQQRRYLFVKGQRLLVGRMRHLKRRGVDGAEALHSRACPLCPRCCVVARRHAWNPCMHAQRWIGAGIAATASIAASNTQGGGALGLSHGRQHARHAANTRGCIAMPLLHPPPSPPPRPDPSLPLAARAPACAAALRPCAGRAPSMRHSTTVVVVERRPAEQQVGGAGYVWSGQGRRTMRAPRGLLADYGVCMAFSRR